MSKDFYGTQHFKEFDLNREPLRLNSIDYGTDTVGWICIFETAWAWMLWLADAIFRERRGEWFKYGEIKLLPYPTSNAITKQIELRIDELLSKLNNKNISDADKSQMMKEVTYLTFEELPRQKKLI